MSEEIKVDAAKFDRVLGRMLQAKPLSKATISERVKAYREARANESEGAKAEREARIKAQHERYKKHVSKKLGQ